jgi:WD40 repeat protein
MHLVFRAQYVLLRILLDFFTLSGSGLVSSVCFSPDGTLLASGSFDMTVKVWDVGSGECVKTLSGHRGRVLSVCFSPDGTLLASGSWDGEVKVWDVGSGVESV